LYYFSKVWSQNGHLAIPCTCKFFPHFGQRLSVSVEIYDLLATYLYLQKEIGENSDLIFQKISKLKPTIFEKLRPEDKGQVSAAILRFSPLEQPKICFLLKEFFPHTWRYTGFPLCSILHVFILDWSHFRVDIVIIFM